MEDTTYTRRRRRRRRDEGTKKDGGMQGQVIDVTMVGDGVWESVYTIPIGVGPYDQRSQYDVQLDTGSADLWLASTDCHSDACGDVPSSNLFSPTDSTRETGQTLSINYAVGAASGPIVWDTVQVGAYAMSNQAFSPATDVENEPIADDFVGVLGLALTDDSLIARAIPPGEDATGDTPDGATLASNLFGLTPTTDAPRKRFFGFLLERSGMPPSADNPAFVPSKFSIGMHPTDDLQNLLPEFTSSSSSFGDDIKGYISSILPQQTTTIDPDPDGAYRYWRTELTLLSIYHPTKTDIPLAGTSSLYPSVILDTGGSIILARPDIANAIYGAFDVHPASDGQYYLPCDTIMNMTLTLSTLPPIAIHPLDLTAPAPSSGTAPGSSNANGCMGVIQANANAPADLVLGAAFLRNVYMVLWHQSPDFGDDDDEGGDDQHTRQGGGDQGSSTRSGRLSSTASVSGTARGSSSVASSSGTVTTGTGTGRPTGNPTGTSPTGTATPPPPGHTTTTTGQNPPPPPAGTAPPQVRKRSPIPYPSPFPRPYVLNPPEHPVHRHSPYRLSSSPDSSSGIPALSLLPLTNITLALEQFNTVRVLNQPLASGGAGGARGAQGDNVKVGHKLSLGIVVLLCLIGLGVVVAGLFVGWWFTQKRKAKKQGLLGSGGGLGSARGLGEKVELRALGSSESGGSHSLGKKSRDEGSEGGGGGGRPGSERSRSESAASVKFVGVAGEVDEFGDARGRPPSKSRTGGKGRNGSQSMSGYFREPEPWEVAGGGTFTDEDGEADHNDNPHRQPHQEFRDDPLDDEDDHHGHSPGDHEQLFAQAFAYEPAPVDFLSSPVFPTHSRTPSQVGEVKKNAPGTTPLLEATSPRGVRDSPEIGVSALPPAVENRNPFMTPRRDSQSSSNGPGPLGRRTSLTMSPQSPPIQQQQQQQQQQNYHRQLRGAMGGDNRYPSLPSTSTSSSSGANARQRRMSDLVDVSVPPPMPIPVPGSSATMPVSGSKGSAGSPYGGIPRAGAMAGDSYFPMLPPMEEFGRWADSPVDGERHDETNGNGNGNGPRRFPRFGSSGSRSFFRPPSS